MPGDGAVGIKLAAANAVDNAAAVCCADVAGVPLAAGNVGKGFRVLGGKAKRSCDDGGKFGSRHGLVRREGVLAHAVDDAARSESFNGRFVSLVLHIGKCRAGCGHSGDVDRSVCFALVDVRRLRSVFYHIAHAIQRVFAVFCAVDGD